MGIIPSETFVCSGIVNSLVVTGEFLLALALPTKERGCVHKFSVKTGQQLATFAIESENPRNLSVMGDSFFVGHQDGAMKVFAIRDGRARPTKPGAFKGHSRKVNSIAFG